MDVLTNFQTKADSSVEDALKALRKLSLAPNKAGKENSRGQDPVDVALKCLKTAQKRLSTPGADIQQLVELCRSCLRVLERNSARQNPTQLHAATYNTLRLLVSAKAFTAALEEALFLHERIHHIVSSGESEHRRGTRESASTNEVANIAIGTVLTLVLCWAEGTPSNIELLDRVLRAAESLEQWLGRIEPTEATSHCQTLFKSLYRGAIRLAEAKHWQHLPRVCLSMVEATAGGAPQALATATKLAAIAPLSHQMTILSAVVTSRRVLACIDARERGSESNSDTGLLWAALNPANALRKTLSTHILHEKDLVTFIEACRGAEDYSAVHATAAALDVMACIVALGARASTVVPQARFTDYSHAAAVSLGCAFKLRTACARLPNARSPSATIGCNGRNALENVLGWTWPPRDPNNLESVAERAVLSVEELCWLSSTFFNVGVELLGTGQTEDAALAISAFQRALQTTISALLVLNKTQLEKEELDAFNVPDVAKRMSALVDALIQAGRPSEAFGAVDDCIAVVLSVCSNANGKLDALMSTAVTCRLILATNGEMAANSSAMPERLSLTAGMQAHPLAPPPERVFRLAQIELRAYAVVCRDGKDDLQAQRALCAGAIRHLLDRAYPAESSPIPHVRLLLLVNALQLHEIVGGAKEDLQLCCRRTLNQRAAATDPRTAIVSALCAAQAVLNQAGALVNAAVESQRARLAARQDRIRLNPSEVHAAVEGLHNDRGALELDHGAWDAILAEAEAVVDGICAAVDDLTLPIVADANDVYCELAAGAAEVAIMMGLHGRAEYEKRAAAAADAIYQRIECQPPDWCRASPCDALRACILPTVSDFGVLPVDTFATSDVESLVEELASSVDRSLAVVLRRAEVSAAAAMLHARSGSSVVNALQCAAEAHRVLSFTCKEERRNGSTVGWWRLSTGHCRIAMLVGKFFENAGMVEEATAAFKEGERMAVAIGSQLLVAAFTCELAGILMKETYDAEARKALEAVKSHLAALPEAFAAAAPSAMVYVQARCASTSACLDARLGDCTPALMSCHEALDACTNLLGNAQCEEDRWHAVDALLSGCLARIQVKIAQGCDRREIAQAAAAALTEVEGMVSCEAVHVLGGGKIAELLAWQAIAFLSPERTHELRDARVWCPGQFKQELDGISDAAACVVDARRWAAWPAAWRALQQSRGAPQVHRRIAEGLAMACGAAGYLNVAGLLLHTSLGATLQLQHLLVLHTRARRAQSSSTTASSLNPQGQLHEAIEALDLGPAWGEAVACLATSKQKPNALQGSELVNTGRGGRKQRTAGAQLKGKKKAEGEHPPHDAHATLTSLDVHSAAILTRWQSHMPPGTAICSFNLRRVTVAGCRHLQDCLVLSRLDPTAGVPPLILEIPLSPLRTPSHKGFSHPIRALTLDDDDYDGCVESTALGGKDGARQGGAASSVLTELGRILRDSAHSMKTLDAATDRDGQREWWRKRVELDDRVGSLITHLDSQWLGPWRSMYGNPYVSGNTNNREQAQAFQRRVDAILNGILEVVTPSALEKLSDLEKQLLRQLVGLVVQFFHSIEANAGAGNLQRAAATVCLLLGVTTNNTAVSADSDTVRRVAKVLLESRESNVDEETTKVGDRKHLATQRRVKFADDGQPTVDDDGYDGENTGSPMERPVLRAHGIVTGTVPAAATGTPSRTPAQTTLRGKKHKSRLGLMNPSAVTPARKSAVPGTAPRPSIRPSDITGMTPGVPRTLPVASRQAGPPRLKRTAGAASRNSTSSTNAPAAVPVIAVFGPDLQSLPWESIPGLAMYRIPSLPCAAASAAASQRGEAVPEVGLSNAYYALNPSGDLQPTQETFETWFRGLHGWEGRAGSPPAAAELESALRSKDLFVYCGHGGGEQYLPPARLRTLPRCAAALLMGCSSGRLRVRPPTSLSGVQGRRELRGFLSGYSGHYEPTGSVLAYLLAGSPVAVATLWDVTDRDIDRFAQALLTRWLSGVNGDEAHRSDVAAAVGVARGACKLPGLIGGATVCYGVPTAVAAPPKRC